MLCNSGELRGGQWEDIDLDSESGATPFPRGKRRISSPLSQQAVNILRELHPLTGSGRYVFPGARSNKRPMSDNTILAAMRRMGID